MVKDLAKWARDKGVKYFLSLTGWTIEGEVADAPSGGLAPADADDGLEGVGNNAMPF